MRLRGALIPVVVVLAAWAAPAAVAPSSPDLPDTAPARRLAELLGHINAGDRDALKAYAVREFVPGMLKPTPDDIVDFMYAQFTANGGYDVRRVLQNAPEQITVLVQGRRATDRWLRLAVGAEPGPPHRVQGFFLFAASAAMAGEDAGPIAPDSLPARLARLLDAIAAEDRFSGTVCLSHGDSVVLRGAWGLADREGGTPNRAGTRFGIASVGKTFTAVAVAKLVAEGRLRFEDPAVRYVPDWLSPAAREVTIAQLLEHRSGLGDFLAVIEAGLPGRRYERLEDYRAIAAADTPAFAPGSAFRYSNTGYLVLGAVIEAVAGEPWDRFLEARVFRHAAMGATSAYRTPGERGVATGYVADAEGRWTRNDSLLIGRGSPAGGSASTADDLNAFGRALRAGTLVPRAVLDSLLAPRVEMAGTGRMYARGFTTSREPRPRIWGHAGGFPGASALLEVYEEGGWVLAVLSNTTEGAGIAGDAWRDLLSRGPRRP